jgi:hypothetical protein
MGTRFAEQFARAQTLQQQGEPASARLVYQEYWTPNPTYDAVHDRDQAGLSPDHLSF